MKYRSLSTALAGLLLISGIAAEGLAGGKWAAQGIFVEGCSCMGVCPCEQTGAKDGCEGVGAMSFGAGSNYNGVDLSGTKIVYATSIGQWIRFYVDAADAAKSKAAGEFASAYYAGFGKVESVKDAKVDLAGTGGKYTVTVDGGNTMKFVTEPVLGGDGKTPISHANTKSLLNPTVLQGRTVSASYKDGERSLTLEGSNSYFNPKMKSSGKL
jgi:hypothetical protein